MTLQDWKQVELTKNNSVIELVRNKPKGGDSGGEDGL